MKLLCCGSRHWTDLETIANVLSTFIDETTRVTLVHGDRCFIDKINKDIRGVDWMCGEIAKQLGFINKEYRIDWTQGKGANFMCNQLILDKEHRHDDPIKLCIAFHDADDLGLGTRDMIDRCHRLSIPVRLVRSTRWHQEQDKHDWRKHA